MLVQQRSSLYPFKLAKITPVFFVNLLMMSKNKRKSKIYDWGYVLLDLPYCSLVRILLQLITKHFKVTVKSLRL